MKKKQHDIQLAQLVDMRSPAAVFEEVKCNFIRYYPVEDFFPVRQAFEDFNALYEGRYPGFRKCNTRFHDKIHTTDALLAISRLIDGYNIVEKVLPADNVQTALIATIMHDSGYIQRKRDVAGTGAKYTLNHVDRSIQFIRDYYRRIGLPASQAAAAGKMVQCTGLGVNVPAIKFADGNERILGLMLGSADILGQMSSRTYLERLVYLYYEFKEGHVAGYRSVLHLLQKTSGFYQMMEKRLDAELKDVRRYGLAHFRKRYGISADLYDIAISRQMQYLGDFLAASEPYHAKLKRTV